MNYIHRCVYASLPLSSEGYAVSSVNPKINRLTKSCLWSLCLSNFSERQLHKCRPGGDLSTCYIIYYKHTIPYTISYCIYLSPSDTRECDGELAAHRLYVRTINTYNRPSRCLSTVRAPHRTAGVTSQALSDSTPQLHML